MLTEIMEKRFEAVAAMFAAATAESLNQAFADAIVDIVSGLDNKRSVAIEYVLLGLLIKEMESRNAPEFMVIPL